VGMNLSSGISPGKKGVVLFIVGLVILCCLPLGLSPYYLSLLMQILVYAIFAMSFDLLLGYLGMLSFWQHAFWGTGAYILGIISFKALTGNFWMILIFVIIMGLILPSIIGLLVMRTAGIYFAFVNFAIASLLFSASFKLRSITGGEDGIGGIPRPLGLDGLQFYFFIILPFFVVCFLLIHWITHSRYGKVIIGIRENPLRMQALGYNIWLYKYSLYIFAGFFGTIAGFLFACYNRFVSPEDYALGVSGMALLMVLIGGRESQIGSIVGAIIIIALFQFVSTLTQYWLLIVGIVFVLVVLFAKEGFIGYVKKRWRQNGYGNTESG